jgi:hypothetical protein
LKIGGRLLEKKICKKMVYVSCCYSNWQMKNRSWIFTLKKQGPTLKSLKSHDPIWSMKMRPLQHWASAIECHRFYVVYINIYCKYSIKFYHGSDRAIECSDKINTRGRVPGMRCIFSYRCGEWKDPSHQLVAELELNKKKGTRRKRLNGERRNI